MPERTDRNEAMRLTEACKHGWLENVDPDKCSLDDLLALLRQQAERIAELEAERDKLTQGIAQGLDGQTLLTDLALREGGLYAGIEGGAAGLLAAGFAEQFVEAGGVNYVEVSFTHPKTGPLIVTLQRAQGKTPHKLRVEAEAERDQLRAEVERLRADAERISVPSELIKRLDASIAWLERGEGLPGHSACIGLEDIKTIRQILSSGITYASNSGLPEKGESVTKVIGMPAEPSLHLLDVGWGICGGDGHASAQPNRQKINAAAANYKALRAALDAARTTHKETE